MNEVLKLNFALDQSQLEISKNNAVVIVPATIVNKIYKYVLDSQKNLISPYGFQKGEIPIGYIESSFKFNIIEHLKECILKHFVVSFLYNELRKNKIITAGEPRFTKANVEIDKDAEFYFEFTSVDIISTLDDWKYLVFRAPKRKNYKDLDKQATAFIKEEQSKKKELDNFNLDVGDWICFDISICNFKNQPILDDIKENVWLKIGDDEPSIPFQDLFINRKVGDSFFTNALCLQDYLDNRINANYNFFVEIKDVINKSFFSIDYLKEHFKLKANKSVHQKLIEVFSFRNDISLRKVIVEEFFDLLFSKIPFQAPKPAVLRQQQEILNIVQLNPDYPVYRMQKDFNDRVKSLAQRQVKETILMDALAYLEDMDVTHNDLKYYLNLSIRPRTKELIYFQHPIIKANEQEYPLPTQMLKQSCLREKTLNYAINNLIRE